MAKQITKFTKVNLKTIRADIDSALEAVLSKHGLSASLGNISFNDSDFNAKIKVSCGSNEDAAEREFARYAFRFGMSANQFGKKFKNGSETYTIVGIKPKSFKYPIIAANKAGKKFKFAAESAKQAA